MSSIQNNGHAREVTLAGTERDEALEQNKRVADGSEDIDGMKLKDGVPEFEKEEYYSFRAQHALVEGNLIIQFFLPAQAKPYIKGDNNPAEQQWMAYWLKAFPAQLDPLAREYFDAEYPRLQVKYTEEVASWWFKGQGYDNLIDLKKFVHDFLVKLNSALQASS